MIDGPDSEIDAQTLHRCFYALRFGANANEYLAGIINELRGFGADISWVRTENLHVTLRFLGELNDEQLERAMNVPSVRVDPFTLAAVGLGAFPGLRLAKTLWAGVGSASDADRQRFLRVQGATEEWARAIGLAPEHRRYRPHVTIGRVRRPGEHLREVVDEITTRECLSPPSPIEEILLLRSRRGVYEDVGRWRVTRL